MAPRSIYSLFLTFALSCCLQATAWGQNSGMQSPTKANSTSEVETSRPQSSEAAPEAKAPESTETQNAETTEPAKTTDASEPDEQTETKPTETASWPDSEKAFEAGVVSYREKKYEVARQAFSFAVEKDPSNVQALTNLALVQFQLGQKGSAVALLRRAQHLDPGFSTPKSALAFILPQLDVKEIPHEIQLWETFRSQVIVRAGLNWFLGLTSLTLLGAGWLMLSYFGRRREALNEDKPLPRFPLTGAFLSFCFFSFLILTGLKFWDLKTPRGTIAVEKVAVHSAPNEQSVSLFDLYGGLEVILKEQTDEWIQVTYPGASTGWIPKNSVLQTTGSDSW